MLLRSGGDILIWTTGRQLVKKEARKKKGRKQARKESKKIAVEQQPSTPVEIGNARREEGGQKSNGAVVAIMARKK